MPLQTRFRPTVLALALTTLAAADAAAQTGRPLAQRLDSLAGAGVLQGRAVGTVAAVVRGTDTLLFKGYGRANVEWDVPMPADAMFEIGSVTKQFTAAAILQLRDEGKLSLDDPITKWLPDFDTRGNTVTVRRLLDHTSGMVGLTEMPEFDLLVWNQAPQGIAVSINGGTSRPAPWVEGTTFRVGGTCLTFRGGDLHLSGGSAYSVLKGQ